MVTKPKTGATPKTSEDQRVEGDNKEESTSRWLKEYITWHWSATNVKFNKRFILLFQPCNKLYGK